MLAVLVQKYLLYWCKSTNTDADIQARDLKDLSEAIKSMPQYKVLRHKLHNLLAFTGAKVQMLTQKALQELLSKYSMHIDLTKKCMAQYEKLQLELVSTEVYTYIHISGVCVCAVCVCVYEKLQLELVSTEVCTYMY